jgi:hypothetical protein
LFEPLRERMAGKQVGLILCGSHIDIDTFARQMIPRNAVARAL